MLVLSAFVNCMRHALEALFFFVFKTKLEISTTNNVKHVLPVLNSK